MSDTSGTAGEFGGLEIVVVICVLGCIAVVPFSKIPFAILFQIIFGLPVAGLIIVLAYPLLMVVLGLRAKRYRTILHGIIPVMVLVAGAFLYMASFASMPAGGGWSGYAAGILFVISLSIMVMGFAAGRVPKAVEIVVAFGRDPNSSRFVSPVSPYAVAKAFGASFSTACAPVTIVS